MSTDIVVAFVVLLIILLITVVPVFLYDTRVGTVAAVVGTAFLVIALASQACMASGGCRLLPWFFVLVYVVMMVVLLFGLALFACSRGNLRRVTAPSWNTKVQEGSEANTTHANGDTPSSVGGWSDWLDNIFRGWKKDSAGGKDGDEKDPDRHTSSSEFRYDNMRRNEYLQQRLQRERERRRG